MRRCPQQVRYDRLVGLLRRKLNLNCTDDFQRLLLLLSVGQALYGLTQAIDVFTWVRIGVHCVRRLVDRVVIDAGFMACDVVDNAFNALLASGRTSVRSDG